MTSNIQTRSRLGVVFPAVAIVGVTWLVFWMAQGFPTMCALVAPCPGRDVRVVPALLFGGSMLAPLVAVILSSSVRSRAGWVVRLSYLVLVLLAVVGYGVISFSGGFGVTAEFLVGLLGTCGTVVLAYLGIVALRRETSEATYPEGTRFLSPRIVKGAIVVVVVVLAVVLILFARCCPSRYLTVAASSSVTMSGSGKAPPDDSGGAFI
ncbi:hypothetical protein, partial [Cryobacterium melibiosiphilum]